MSIDLKKGQTINLKKNVDNSVNDLSTMTIGLGWDVNDNGQDYDLDACALLLEDGVLKTTSDVVYYANLKHSSGTVWSTGDNLTGAGDGDDEQLIVKLDSIPKKYNKIIFFVSIYKGQNKNQVLSRVDNAFIRAVDANDKEIAKYSISGDKSATNMCSLVFAEVERTGDTWEFKAVGDVYKTDSLLEIADLYKKSTTERKKFLGMF